MSVAVEPLRSGDPKGVGRYRFLGRLGAGGMGLVCLGRGPDGRLVAVKLIHEDIAADPDYRRRFAREVRAAAAVQARFTAAVVDADPQAPQPWYASEFIDGPTVGQIVRRTGPLAERALRALAAGLAEAVAAFETAGLVHRDLKPDNILMAPDGPKVIDFGIARGENDSLLTRAGSVLGSPGYMSPEQIAGDRVRTASDVFSLGAVITFAGQAAGPFGDGPAESRMYLTKFGDPDLSGLPTALRPPILQCLAKKPGDRPTPRQLVSWWSVRPDELDTLIEVGRGPGAQSAESVRPAGERLYGAGGANAGGASSAAGQPVGPSPSRQTGPAGDAAAAGTVWPLSSAGSALSGPAASGAVSAGSAAGQVAGPAAGGAAVAGSPGSALSGPAPGLPAGPAARSAAVPSPPSGAAPGLPAVPAAGQPVGPAPGQMLGSAAGGAAGSWQALPTPGPLSGAAPGLPAVPAAGVAAVPGHVPPPPNPPSVAASSSPSQAPVSAAGDTPSQAPWQPPGATPAPAPTPAPGPQAPAARLYGEPTSIASADDLGLAEPPAAEPWVPPTPWLPGSDEVSLALPANPGADGRLDSRLPTMLGASAPPPSAPTPYGNPFAAREWTPPPQPPRRPQPWWRQPVGVDRLPGGVFRDLLAGLLGAGLLAAFSFPTPNTALGVAFAAVALALGFVLGVHRSVLALAAYAGAALGGVKVLPGKLSASVHDPSLAFLLEIAVLLLFAAVIARVGGLRRRPVLGFAVAFAGYIAGQAAAVAWVAGQSHVGFLDAWRAGTDGLLIYRDAGIAAVCAAAVGFLTLIGSTQAVGVDGPHRATGEHR